MEDLDNYTRMEILDDYTEVDLTNSSWEENLTSVGGKGQVHAQAQFELGHRCIEKRDYEKAKESWISAANNGHVEASCDLGILYSKCLVVEGDYIDSVEWFKLAANKGNLKSQHNLGVLYNNGEGVHRDYILAYKWFNIARAKGHKKSYEKCDDLHKIMSNDNIVEAQKLSREWPEVFAEDEVLNLVASQ